jgi:hypothetical protein
MHAEPGHGDNQCLFEIANVSVDVAAIRPQIEDRISDQLAGTVIRHVAAAAGFVDFNALSGQRGRRRDDIRVAAASLRAERDDRRMLEQQQRVANPPGAPILDQLPLQLERRGIIDSPEPPDVYRHLR